MDYFKMGLFSGNAKFWVAMLVLGAWAGAALDIITGVFNGLWVLITLIFTALVLLAYYGIPALIGLEKKKKIKAIEEEAVLFDAQREKEIRKILEENPQFATHCYECIHFNPDLLHCARKLSKKISYQRVKEITINGKNYCLYWEQMASATD